MTRSNPDPLQGGPEADLGPRVRRLRKSRGLTLEALAQKSGVSRASLSKIEREEMSPTYETLRKLATGLEVAMTTLVMEPEIHSEKAFKAVRSGQGQRYGNPLYEYELLSGSQDGGGETIYLSEILASDIGDFPDLHAHNTRDFLYVLRGTVMAYFEGHEPVRLEVGDSLTFDGRQRHAFTSRNRDDETARVLWVSRPV
jgi:transcriptional regulator with XRE-family HTH domain